MEQIRLFGSWPTLMTPMQFRVELFCCQVVPRRQLARGPNREPEMPGGTGFRGSLKGGRDMASPFTGVMLHLRSCYVSKAAILTVPVQPVPVENRSPA
jgi:hypothetical protein